MRAYRHWWTRHSGWHPPHGWDQHVPDSDVHLVAYKSNPRRKFGKGLCLLIEGYFSASPSRFDPNQDKFKKPSCSAIACKQSRGSSHPNANNSFSVITKDSTAKWHHASLLGLALASPSHSGDMHLVPQAKPDKCLACCICTELRICPAVLVHDHNQGSLLRKGQTARPKFRMSASKMHSSEHPRSFNRICVGKKGGHSDRPISHLPQIWHQSKHPQDARCRTR